MHKKSKWCTRHKRVVDSMIKQAKSGPEKAIINTILMDAEKARAAVDDRLRLHPHLESKYFRAPPLDFSQLKEQYVVATNLREQFISKPA